MAEAFGEGVFGEGAFGEGSSNLVVRQPSIPTVFRPEPGFEFPAHYYYNLVASNGQELTILRDEAVPKITGGRGGWQIVDRRRRKGLTTWTGREPLKMDLPVLFNGQFDPPYSIDADVSVLMSMANGDNFVIPPTVKVQGYIPATGVNWVIDDLTWGDNAVWLQGTQGDYIRVRQDCVIHLLQFVEEDVVNIKNVNTKPHVYTTKQGDTLKSIAKAIFGIGFRWKDIYRVNADNLSRLGVSRAPYSPLPAGIELIIPGAGELRATG